MSEPVMAFFVEATACNLSRRTYILWAVAEKNRFARAHWFVFLVQDISGNRSIRRHSENQPFRNQIGADCYCRRVLIVLLIRLKRKTPPHTSQAIFSPWQILKDEPAVAARKNFTRLFALLRSSDAHLHIRKRLMVDCVHHRSGDPVQLRDRLL